MFFQMQLLTEQKVKNTWVSSDKVLMTSESEDDVIYVVDPTEGTVIFISVFYLKALFSFNF